MDDTTKRDMFSAGAESGGSFSAWVPWISRQERPRREVERSLFAGPAGGAPAHPPLPLVEGKGAGQVEPPTTPFGRVQATVGAVPLSEPAASEMTYASKLPPDHPGLRLERPRGRVLRRGPLLAAAALLTAIVLIATVVAFSPRTEQAHASSPNLPEEPQTGNVTVPDDVQNAPTGKLDAHPEPPRLGPPLHGAEPGPSQTPVQGANEQGAFASSGRPSAREVMREEREKALTAPILVDLDGPSPDGLAKSPGANGGVLGPSAPTGFAAPEQTPATPLLGGAGSGDPNMQQHKSDFLAREAFSANTYLNQAVLSAKSPFEIKAGTIIPASLVTAINSDLPGQIIGQVRENVYDTLTGNHLLIPQGSRLLASYDSLVAYGQARVLFCWNRLIRPDGVSISLECMPGADLAGASGAADDVDHHWWRIVTGIALGTLLSATAERAAGNVTGYQLTVAQNWAANAGGAVNQAGQQITQRNLAIQPTITVRAGYSVNVIVTKDIVLPPFARPPRQ